MGRISATVLACSLLGATLFLLTACETGSSQSLAQRAYNACTDSHNSKRQSFNGGWAFVSGVGSSDTTCFMRWNASDAQAAANAALQDCHAEYQDCYVYSTSDGNSDWVQRISDNGGSDGGGGGGGGSDWSLSDVLGVGAAGLNLYNAYSSGGGGGGGISSPASGGGSGTDCNQYLTLANECRASQQSMSSLSGGLDLTGSTSGSGGQDSQFEACYNNYIGAYNACIAAQ